MNDFDIPEHKLSDSLFVLVGGNPLPAWVATRLLMRPGGKLFLVCSAGEYGSAPIARQLGKFLERNGSNAPEYIEVIKESDPAEIYQKLAEKVRQISSGKLGLNYTGGTKVMSVYAYLALQNEHQQGVPPPICSYLDARHLCMYFDPSPGQTASQPFPVGMNEKGCISLEDLVSLHNCRLTEQPSREVVAPGVIDEIVCLHATARGFRIWRDWRNAAHSSIAQNSTKPQDIPLPNGSGLEPIGRALARGQDPTGLTLGNVYSSWCFTTPGDLLNWLDGFWVEHLVSQILAQQADAMRLTDWGRNLIVINEKNQPKNNFETDVLLSAVINYLWCHAQPEMTIKRSSSKNYSRFIFALAR